MKTFISGVILLGLSVPFLVSDRSVANDSTLSSNRKTSLIAQTAGAERFNVVGTEPFWNVTVSRSGIVYSSPEVKRLAFPYVTPLRAAGRPDDFVRVYQLKGKGINTLIIKKDDQCSDGMSDKVYPYSATFILGNKVLEGCAEKK
ncbi:COG3650 family protein [Scytonema sp. NUACC21]